MTMGLVGQKERRAGKVYWAFLATDFGTPDWEMKLDFPSRMFGVYRIVRSRVTEICA